MKFSRSIIFAALVGVVSLMTVRADNAVPDRPEKISFPPLKYDPPTPESYRTQLQAGPVAYVIPDRQLPLVNIVIYIRVGQYLEPVGKEGLADLTGWLLRHGGAGTNSAEQLEERLAFLGAEMDASIDDTEGSVSLNLLSKDLDEGLGMLHDVLFEPRFQADQITLRKQQILQDMEQRNDDSAGIEGREAGFLSYGENFWANRYPTSNSIASIAVTDIAAFHHRWFSPANFVVAVSGDFDRDAMIAKLEQLFSRHTAPVATRMIIAHEIPPPIPTNTVFAAPGVYIVNKPDVNQGRVSVMLPGISRYSPDYYAVIMMNDILGGGGFTSHIMSRVRSDEGLAYDARSTFPGGVYYPFTFTASFQSKSRTVPYAASIVREEIVKMTTNTVKDTELSDAKRAFINRFPHTFVTKSQTATIFAHDEFTGRYARDPHFWAELRSRIEAVTADDVLRVAQKYLLPDKLVILVVGNKDDIMLGYPNHPAKLSDLGNITDLPLRDPMTMQPMTAPPKN
ncbi:MAG TPA: pitrilysin family protein [Verrucomicrobiae bacterium]|nr:pitrilysin family protein [Verrucomicrobiae bacterium]